MTHLGLRKLSQIYKNRQSQKEINKYAVGQKTLMEIEQFYKKL